MLSYNELCSEIAAKKVLAKRLPDGSVVEIDFNHINSASIDVCLGRFVLREVGFPSSPTLLDYRARDKMSFERIEIGEYGYIVKPGEFLLTETEEVFNLPLDISAEYALKSSMARIGLEHLKAGFCDAGWTGSVLTLELKNMSNFHSILLRPGDAIGQMIFFRHEPVPEDRSYAARGRYNNNTTVNTIRP